MLDEHDRFARDIKLGVRNFRFDLGGRTIRGRRKANTALQNREAVPSSLITSLQFSSLLRGLSFHCKPFSRRSAHFLFGFAARTPERHVRRPIATYW